MRDNAVTLRNTQCCVLFHRCPPPKILGAALISTDDTLCFGISPAKIRVDSLLPNGGDHNRIKSENVGVDYPIPLPRPQDKPPDKLLTMRYSTLLVMGTILRDHESRNPDSCISGTEYTAFTHWPKDRPPEGTLSGTGYFPDDLVRGKTTFLWNTMCCVVI